MQSVSARWAPALTSSHAISTRVAITYGGTVLVEDLQFVSGSVTVDRGSDTRRSLSLTVADPAQFPVSATDPLAVYGQRIYVERGIRYLDGSVERVPVGVFVITGVSGDVHTGPVEITGAGLEVLLKRAHFETAVSSKNPGTVAGFIRSHLEELNLSFVDRSTNGATTLASKTWDANTDMWSAMTEVATAIGAELYCDANGTFVLADVPRLTSTPVSPVWDVSAGTVMVSADMSLTSDDVYNRVIASGENAQDDMPPVQATATITDPSDPLHYDGPYGRATYTYSSSLITTQAQAGEVAATLLNQKRQANRSVTISAVPNPALDAGDWIRVDYGNRPPELHLVQRFSLPLSVSGDAFTIETVGGHAEG